MWEQVDGSIGGTAKNKDSKKLKGVEDLKVIQGKHGKLSPGIIPRRELIAIIQSYDQNVNWTATWYLPDMLDIQTIQTMPT